MTETSIVVPTLKEPAAVVALLQEIRDTAGCPVSVLATCRQASAPVNRNIGLNWATSPVLLMVDDDITGLPQGWVARMLEVMAQFPQCVMASPRLMKPDGSPGIMTGGPRLTTGCEILRGNELCTACIALRNTELRFDEHFIGSGFEDNDYCRQLRYKVPGAQFICVHDVKVTHLNEMKNQHGPYWDHNRPYYLKKWNLA